MLTGYVIITPAHNEAALIAQTAESMAAQTVRPLKWVVVNDASTDRTRELIEAKAGRHSFIEVVNLERAAGRHFGNKVRAFNAGLDRVKHLDFAFVGNLDADMTLEPTYFEELLKRFAADPKLGLAGGMVHTTVGDRFVSQNVALDSVAGAVQLFRRECFERIGGYQPMPGGGIDSAAEIAARMHGWRTRTFPELRTLEHRLTGTANASPLGACVKLGRRMYSLGYSPVFFCLRCLYRISQPPRLIGSGALLYGYFSDALRWKPQAVSPEVVRFLRKEQHGKLKRMLRLGSV
ncbi:MAG TPA: glycosyltransferase family 2 protein [Verrucomicrobiae bacterium]|nr:glycosyltransferase family 2 protein [Verrucomicrobiae bacterium]